MIRCDLYTYRFKLEQHAKYLGQRSFYSKVIIRIDRPTDRQTYNDRLLYVDHKVWLAVTCENSEIFAKIVQAIRGEYVDEIAVAVRDRLHVAWLQQTHASHHPLWRHSAERLTLYRDAANFVRDHVDIVITHAMSLNLLQPPRGVVMSTASRVKIVRLTKVGRPIKT